MKPGKTIVKIKFGSHLYGTNTPASDADFKAVHLPSGDEILLDKVRHSINKSTKNGDGKNTNEDTDFESFSVQRFLELLLEGQTVALDMIFSTKESWVEYTPEWEFIVERREHFLHKGISAFFGYARQQASKYGVKGSRVHAIRQVVDLLKTLNLHDKIGMHSEKFENLVKNQNQGISDIPIMGFVDLDSPGRIEKLRHFECCNKKVSFLADVKQALEVYGVALDRYGKRALQAETNEGIDWKALSHAVRVAQEAVELLQTGHITFPRPERDLLLKIKKGEMAYREVATLIEELFEIIKTAQSMSKLPEAPLFSLKDQIVLEMNLAQVIGQ